MRTVSCKLRACGTPAAESMATLERNAHAQGQGWLVAEDITLIGGDGGKVNAFYLCADEKKGTQYWPHKGLERVGTVSIR